MSAEQHNGVDDCPQCHAENVAVVDSRQHAIGRTRRRRCMSCGHRWSTLEIAADTMYDVRNRAHAAAVAMLRAKLAEVLA